MDVLGQHLDERRRATAQGGNVSADLVRWLNRDEAPEVRLLRFDAWLRAELASRLDWAWAGAQRERRIEQCRIYLERLVLDLWRRGWMLDGRALATRLQGVLDRVASYQKAGRVGEFWPYFRATVDRYVGQNAEELQAEAMGMGAHVGQLLSAIKANSRPVAAALPELLAQRREEIDRAKAETLREKQARQRARDAACRADADQPRLF